MEKRRQKKKKKEKEFPVGEEEQEEQEKKKEEKIHTDRQRERENRTGITSVNERKNPWGSSPSGCTYTPLLSRCLRMEDPRTCCLVGERESGECLGLFAELRVCVTAPGHT